MKNKKLKYILLLMALAVSFLSFGKSIIFHEVSGHFNAEVFTIESDSISIEGVFIGDRNKNKPMVIFIPGSGLMPIYASRGDSSFYPLIPHQMLKYRDSYNFVVLSKPGVPAVVELSKLDEKYYYADPETGKIPENYIDNNNLDFYTAMHKILINKLDSIADFNKLIVMGHSQGARIAAEFSSCTSVDKIVYMSADPLGRIAVSLDMEYAKFEERNEEKIDFYKSIFTEEEGIYWGDTYESWRSFSKPPLLQLSQSKKPILVVYGEMDRSCPNCYVFKNLPTYQENIDVLNYPSYDHHYFDEQKENNWDKVMKDVFGWIESE